jgi:phosphatidate cytidylyltransferase
VSQLAPSKRGDNNMLLRLGSAAVLIALLLGALIAGSVWVYAAVAVILGAALFEYLQLTRALHAPAPIWLLFPLSYALLLRGRIAPVLDLTQLLALTTVVGLAAMVFLKDWRSSLTRWALAVGGSLYLGYLLSFYLDLYFLTRGFWYVVSVIAVVSVGDTAAMLVGTRFGKHPFFPSISPKKTLEGAIAQLVASIVLMAALSPFTQLGLFNSLVLGLLIGVLAEVGDLVESQIKRTAGVKDASQLIPGHGGVLDRIDSVLLAGAAVYYYVQFFHLS